MDNIEETVKRMILEEKADLVMGNSNMTTYPVSRLNVRSITFSDGPNGLRKEKEGSSGLDSISLPEPTTCFPCGVNLASTFDKDLIKRVSVALGEECSYFGVNVLLGPAVNINRSPLGGRNFEYYSEDPCLAGTIGTSYVLGLQSQGVGACVKHYALNNNEANRFVGNSLCDERAMREIYLKPFETIVKETNPLAIMTSYNLINGTHASENRYLLHDILRTEWGFDGVVMADWGGLVNKTASLHATNDLEMPGSVKHNRDLVISESEKGTLAQDDLDAAVRHLLVLGQKTDKPRVEKCDFKEHAQLAYEAAVGSAVLLKNEDKVLPLSKDKKYLIIGSLFEHMRYQGSGSSMIYPIKTVSIKKAFNDEKVQYDYVEGYLPHDDKIVTKLENAALLKANDYDEILFFGGLIDGMESEGFDRDDISLPKNQVELINKLGFLHKKMVLVLFGGNVIDLPFEKDFAGIINMQFAGEMCGLSTYSLLFGLISPSGRLVNTYPKSLADVPFNKEFGTNINEHYKESIYVGYRYYTTFNVPVLYPFGYGLSYASFSYSDLEVSQDEKQLFISVKVKNTSDISASEVVEVFVRHQSKNTDFPLRQLKAFDKVFLESKEEKTVKLVISKDDLKYYSMALKRFVLDDGEYVIEVNKDANQVILSENLELQGENIKETGRECYLNKEKVLSLTDEEYEKIANVRSMEHSSIKNHYTLETPFKEYQTHNGKLLLRLVSRICKRQGKKAEKIEDEFARDRTREGAKFIQKMLPSFCIRNACYSAGKMFTYEMALGLLDFVNGHTFRGFHKLLKEYKKVAKKDN
ncbi:MAG: glycoside hydrolase family 3 N-terminal domain-containing protein [Bacilli bacterium]